MLLTIDVGNTNITMGIFKDEEIIAHFRLATVHERSMDEYGVLFVNFLLHRGIAVADIGGVIIASVVPEVMYSLERAVRNYIGKTPHVVKRHMVDMEVKIDNPAELGADRLINAYAAKFIYGAPLIIVDFGTATTFCTISAKGEYLGGAICPGIKISLDALFSKTSKLPRVEIRRPEKVIGTNTVGSMQSGILYGYVGQVNFIVEKIKEEMGERDVKVIATGGLSNLINAETDIFHAVDKLLTLKGLKKLYDEKFKN